MSHHFLPSPAEKTKKVTSAVSSLYCVVLLFPDRQKGQVGISIISEERSDVPSFINLNRPRFYQLTATIEQSGVR